MKIILPLAGVRPRTPGPAGGGRAMHEELEKLAEEARQKIARTSSTAELNQVRIDLFGKKGSITQLSRRLKEFSRKSGRFLAS